MKSFDSIIYHIIVRLNRGDSQKDRSLFERKSKVFFSIIFALAFIINAEKEYYILCVKWIMNEILFRKQ